MKCLLFIAAITFNLTMLGQTRTFKGAWFDIKYPASFTAKGSIKSATSDRGYESAFFQSPDKTVEFYIFSPQWSGDPTDISLKSNEKLSSTNTQKSGSTISKWWTIVAKDGSYTRSYQEKRDNSLNTSMIFGIKYKNINAYNRYKSNYLSFKASLTQYAD